MNAPDWLVVGASVVEVGWGGGFRPCPTVTPATITKIGKRDVVLDTGNRYNINSVRTTGYDGEGSVCLTARSGGAWDSSKTDMFHPDAPEVARAVKERNEQRRIERARSLCSEITSALRSASHNDLPPLAPKAAELARLLAEAKS